MHNIFKAKQLEIRRERYEEKGNSKKSNRNVPKKKKILQKEEMLDASGNELSQEHGFKFF